MTTNTTNIENRIQYDPICELDLILPSPLVWADIDISTVTPPTYSIATNPTGCTGEIIGNSSYLKCVGATPPYTCYYVPFSFAIRTGTYVGSYGGYCDILTCATTPSASVICGVLEGDIVNPFVYGIKGNWRPKTAWSYLGGRSQSKSPSHNNLNFETGWLFKNLYSFL